ncbi:MAG TPA: hypothetical protein VF812_05305 [Ktedonobacterales bacterium]
MVMLSTLLLYLAPFVALALAGVATFSLSAFGGAQRNALALLATRVFSTPNITE